MEANIFDIFKEQAEKFNVTKLANALLKSVEDIGYPPQRLRVFTSYKAFSKNISSVNDMKDLEVLYSDNKKLNVKYSGIPYFYAYADSVDIDTEDKYNSIFLGVGYSSNSFNRFNILEQGVYKGIKYAVYVVPRSPKCLRVGIIGHWSKSDLQVFNNTTSSNFFTEQKGDGMNGGE